MKAAARERLGVIAYERCAACLGEGKPTLQLPLFALVDYLGYRLSAIALAPIDSTTLQYGSPNAGIDCINSDEQVRSPCCSFVTVCKGACHHRIVAL